MFGNSIKLDKELFNKAKKFALSEGYSSVEELISHLLEREIAQMESNDPASDSDADEDVKKRLEGLGYIS